jgi:tripartite-type tricarboxylate transporter receptor subunit TctC
VHILCSGPAGSIPDLVARAVADQLLVTAGMRAVVDNRPGAAGQISVGALKGAAADGSTLLLALGAIATLYPHLYAKLAYDPAVDLQPVLAPRPHPKRDSRPFRGGANCPPESLPVNWPAMDRR